MNQKFRNTKIELGEDAEKLSPQQRIVLLMICMGLSDKMIAKAINRSPETVKTHVKILFCLFGVDTRAALVREAVFHKLVVNVAAVFLAALMMPAVMGEVTLRYNRLPQGRQAATYPSVARKEIPGVLA
ncbi:response regulator transcription factor [Marinobacter salarius]|jgi:DNA-binding CsgD family transcriptional regulator|uniref:response regulator transcription factor n=1 Tax=Marinobacter salarius TaxID=1420917 RepID=UPI0010AA4084|nr:MULTISPECIES: LuxR C-terminal-related transcriptional regulator [Marinobacter]MBJ7302487.1 response regulator transcription factor [Marinobacter salarius]HIO30762.1 response regulator transcription factor [Marinobacter salarius]HIP01739.1 response regulator transcription factor [Marinobacter salarius]